MQLFGRSLKEITDRYRLEVLAEANRLRDAGRLIGPDAEEYGERVEKALLGIALNSPVLPSKVPPAFTELRIAAIEGLGNSPLRKDAEASISRIEARVASLLKHEFPALAGVDLGVDDLTEMARAGFRLRARFQEQAKEIADGEKGTFLARVRARKSASEIEALRVDAADVDPRNRYPSNRALALIALEAVTERLSGQPEVLDPRVRNPRKSLHAPSNDLIAFAAQLSVDLRPSEREKLRLEIARSGRDLELACDIEKASREDEKGFSFPWMSRA